MKKLFAVFFLLFSLCANAQNEVKIGEQIWMSRNLNVTNFRNGDPILQVKNQKEWDEAVKNKLPAYCYKLFKSENSEKFGIIYNWYAVSDSRILAPKGWMIPSENDWSKMLNYTGPKNAEKLKSTLDWPIDDDLMLDYNGDNSSGFNAIPAGKISQNYYHHNFAGFWTSTEKDISNVAAVVIKFDDFGKISVSSFSKNCGFSVRCIKK